MRFENALATFEKTIRAFKTAVEWDVLNLSTRIAGIKSIFAWTVKNDDIIQHG